MSDYFLAELARLSVSPGDFKPEHVKKIATEAYQRITARFDAPEEATDAMVEAAFEAHGLNAPWRTPSYFRRVYKAMRSAMK